MFDTISRQEGLSPMTGFTSLVASMIVHAAVVGLMVVVPLFFLKSLPEKPLAFLQVLPPMPVLKIPAPLPPSLDKAAGEPAGGVTRIRTKIPVERIGAPNRIPEGILPAPPDEVPVFIGIPESGWGLVSEGPPADIGIPWTAGKFNPPLPPEPPQKPTPIRIGTLEPSKILFKVSPEYPRLARISRVEGDVRLEAMIDEQGSVADVRILEGHRLLIDAAVRAVEQWKYTPTIQNGEPVPVLATIRISFRLR